MWQPIATIADADGTIVVLSIDDSGHWTCAPMSWSEEDEAFVVSGQNSVWAADAVKKSYQWWSSVPYDGRDWTRQSGN